MLGAARSWRKDLLVMFPFFFLGKNLHWVVVGSKEIGGATSYLRKLNRSFGIRM
jgi:hypothetical protein